MPIFQKFITVIRSSLTPAVETCCSVSSESCLFFREAVQTGVRGAGQGQAGERRGGRRLQAQCERAFRRVYNQRRAAAVVWAPFHLLCKAPLTATVQFSWTDVPDWITTS